MRKDADDRAHDLAVQVYGHGAAVSLDFVPGGVAARAWDKAGIVVCEAIARTKTTARAELVRRMCGKRAPA